MKLKITVMLTIVLMAGVNSFGTPIYGDVTMSFTGEGACNIMQIWGGGWNGQSVYAGIYMFNKTGGSGQGANIDNGSVGVFCIDLLEEIQPGSLTYDVINTQDGPRPTTFLGTTMGEQKADYLSELWGRYYDASWATNGSHTAQENSNAESFAAAVWEIVYEDLPTSPALWDVTTDGTAGSKGFRASGLDYITANNWLHSLDGTGPKGNVMALSYIGSQDFIADPIYNGNIPEPSTIGMIAFGIFFTIRRKNAVQTA